MRYSLPGSPFLHQCLTLFHSSAGSAGVTSKSLIIDLTKTKPPGVSTHPPPPPPLAFNWREGLLGLELLVLLAVNLILCSTWHFWGGWAGNRCLRDPFSLLLNPCEGVGRDGNTAGLGLLNQGHTSNSSHMDVWIMLAFQYRHEAPPLSHVPRPLIRWVIQLVGSIHALLHFPCPISPTKAIQIIFVLFFIPLTG